MKAVSTVLSALVLFLQWPRMLAAAGGWGGVEELCGADDAFYFPGSVRPAIVCDAASDCLAIYSVVSNSKKNYVQLKYRTRNSSTKTWSDEAFALRVSRSDSSGSKNRIQTQPQLVALGDQGWAVAYRNIAAEIYSGALDTTFESVRIAYINKSSSLNRQFWRGDEEGYAIAISEGSGYKRYPDIAADANGTVVVVWETVSSADLDLGDDKDILASSFSLSSDSSPYALLDDFISETALTQIMPVYAGSETDLIQDRNPVLVGNPNTGRIVIASTATISGGHAEIMFAESKSGFDRACSWENRIRVTNNLEKDADGMLAASPVSDTWMLIWQHMGLGIRWARLTPGATDKLRVEAMGFVEPIAFPYILSDEEMYIIADPSQAKRWAVFYRWQVPGTENDANRLFRLVFRITKNDGETWSSAYFLDDEVNPSEQLFEHRFTTNQNGEILAAMVFKDLDSSSTGSYRVASTTSRKLFDYTLSDQYKVEDIPYQESTLAVSCFELTLPTNGSQANVVDYLTTMASAITQCVKITSDSPDPIINIDMNMTENMELFEEYLGSCPFNFIGFREANSIASGDFGIGESRNVNDLGGLTRRVCTKGGYHGIKLHAKEVYVFVSFSDQANDSVDAVLPINLTAWSNSSNSSSNENAEESELISFQSRKANSYEELADILDDSTFVQGEILLTTDSIDLTYELVIEEGRNISLIGATSSGEQVQVRGGEFIHVHRGGLLWRLENMMFYRKASIFKGDSRFGGLIYVQGTLGRIKNCLFENSKAGGDLGQRYGGALTVDGRIDDIVETTFLKMSSTTGGAISLTGRGQIGTIRSCTFDSNSQNDIRAGDAGALYVPGYIDRIIDTTFISNSCNSAGGAVNIASGGQVRVLENVNFINNTANLAGGAIAFEANSRLPEVWRGGQITGNSALVAGGAIYIVGALPSLTFSLCSEFEACFGNLIISRNKANKGGGIYIEDASSVSAFRVNGGVISLNEASLTLGGAILLSGGLVMDLWNASFSSNTAITTGGAIALTDGARLDIDGSEFTNNVADQQGGALFADLGTILNAQNSNFTENSASFTCREQTVCNLQVEWSTRSTCGAFRMNYNGSSYQTAECQLTDTGLADASKGCTKGVGGSIYLAAGVVSHIHRCDFRATNPLPKVQEESAYTDSVGNTGYFADKAGRFVYSESRFRLSESTYQGKSTSFAPYTSIVGCPGTCSSLGTCFAFSDTPSVTCSCTGAVEGTDGYEEGGCRRRRVGNVIATATQYTATNKTFLQESTLTSKWPKAEGYVNLSWTWEGDIPDLFLIYSTNQRDIVNVPSLTSCVESEDAQNVVAPCVWVRDPEARTASIGLQGNTSTFFRVRASVASLYTTDSDAMSSASTICEPGAQLVPAAADGSYLCEFCPRGFYVENPKIGCVQCPNELLTTRDRATSANDCFAPEGYYLIESDNGEVAVKPCIETEMVCSQAGHTIEDIILQPGWWRAKLDSEELVECEVAARCIGGDGHSGMASSGSRRALDVWTDPMYCAEGHLGPYCSVCEDGYSLNSSQVCEICTDERSTEGRIAFYVIVVGSSVLYTLIIIGLFSYDTWQYTKSDSPRSSGGKFKVPSCLSKCWLFGIFREDVRERCTSTIFIAIGYFQVAYAFQRIFGRSYVWLGEWDGFNKVIALINFDTTRASSYFGCFIQEDQAIRVLFSTLTFIVALVLPWVYYLIYSQLFIRFRKLRVGSSEFSSELRARSWTITYSVIVFLYPQTNLTIVQTFVYQDLPGDNTTRFLRFDPSTNVEDLGWWWYYAVFAAILFSMGPVFVFTVLISFRVRGAEGLYQQYSDPERLRQDFCRFTPVVRQYFQVFDMVRKYLQTSVALLVMDGTVGQLAFLNLVTFIGTIIQLLLNPYHDTIDNFAASASYVGLYFFLTIILWTKGGDIDHPLAAQAGLWVLFGGMLVFFALCILLKCFTKVRNHIMEKSSSYSSFSGKCTESPSNGGDSAFESNKQAPLAGDCEGADLNPDGEALKWQELSSQYAVETSTPLDESRQRTCVLHFNEFEEEGTQEAIPVSFAAPSEDSLHAPEPPLRGGANLPNYLSFEMSTPHPHQARAPRTSPQPAAASPARPGVPPPPPPIPDRPCIKPDSDLALT